MERKSGFGVGRWASKAGFTMVGNWLTFFGRFITSSVKWMHWLDF